ncbi:hypothetical protein V8C86DRAFT_2625789 [Haematococcus lacustris]
MRSPPTAACGTNHLCRSTSCSTSSGGHSAPASRPAADSAWCRASTEAWLSLRDRVKALGLCSGQSKHRAGSPVTSRLWVRDTSKGSSSGVPGCSRGRRASSSGTAAWLIARQQQPAFPSPPLPASLSLMAALPDTARSFAAAASTTTEPGWHPAPELRHTLSQATTLAARWMWCGAGMEVLRHSSDTDGCSNPAWNTLISEQAAGAVLAVPEGPSKQGRQGSAKPCSSNGMVARLPPAGGCRAKANRGPAAQTSTKVKMTFEATCVTGGNRSEAHSSVALCPIFCVA